MVQGQKWAIPCENQNTTTSTTTTTTTCYHYTMKIVALFNSFIAFFFLDHFFYYLDFFPFMFICFFAIFSFPLFFVFLIFCSFYSLRLISYLLHDRGFFTAPSRCKRKHIPTRIRKIENRPLIYTLLPSIHHHNKHIN